MQVEAMVLREPLERMEERENPTGLKERLPRHNECPVEVETMNLSCFPSARLGCFLQAALSGPGVGAEKVDKWIALSLGDLQDGYDGWTVVSERGGYWQKRS